jgi:hypothetical protein
MYVHLVGTAEEVSTRRHGTQNFKILSVSLKVIHADLKYMCITSDSFPVPAANCEQFFHAR